jgi:hypothetical protein
MKGPGTELLIKEMRAAPTVIALATVVGRGKKW